MNKLVGLWILSIFFLPDLRWNMVFVIKKIRERFLRKSRKDKRLFNEIIRILKLYENVSYVETYGPEVSNNEDLCAMKVKCNIFK